MVFVFLFVLAQEAVVVNLGHLFLENILSPRNVRGNCNKKIKIETNVDMKLLRKNAWFLEVSSRIFSVGWHDPPELLVQNFPGALPLSVSRC